MFKAITPFTVIMTSDNLEDRELLAKKLLSHDLRIMDAGSGEGCLSAELARYGPEQVVAVDINEHHILETKKNVKSQGVTDYVSPVRTDLRRASFRSETFDAIVSYHLLCSVKPKDLNKIMSEFYRILRKRGKFLMLEQSPTWKNQAQRTYILRCQLARAIRSRFGPLDEGYLYDDKDVEASLSNVGFTDISVKKWERELKVPEEKTKKFVGWVKKYSNVLELKQHKLLSDYIKMSGRFGEEHPIRLLVEGYKS